MVSNRTRAGIAGVLAAATLHVMPAGEAQAEPSLEGQQQAKVVTLTPTQLACSPCNVPHVVQKGGRPQATTNVDFLEGVLADLFQKQKKNAIIVISDKPLDQNKELINQLASLAQRLYNENGVMIDYVMQVYTATNKQRAFPLEGTIRLYIGGYAMDVNPRTNAPIRTVDDVNYVLKVAEVELKKLKNGLASSKVGSSGGDGKASTDISPPDFPVHS